MNDVLFLGVSVVCWFLGYDLVCSDHARSSYHTILAKPRKAGFFLSDHNEGSNYQNVCV